MANYIETYHGRKIDFLDPDPEQFCLEDIVHALRNVPRFGGHTQYPYSVMAHSLNVARLVPADQQFAAALHDATEAYLLDMPTPFKRMLPDYMEAERRMWLAICQKFDLDPELSADIHAADKVALMTERDMLKPGHGDWGPELEGIVRAPAHMFNWETPTRTRCLKIIEAYKDVHRRFKVR